MFPLHKIASVWNPSGNVVFSTQIDFWANHFPLLCSNHDIKIVHFYPQSPAFLTHNAHLRPVSSWTLGLWTRVTRRCSCVLIVSFVCMCVWTCFQHCTKILLPWLFCHRWGWRGGVWFGVYRSVWKQFLFFKNINNNHRNKELQYVSGNTFGRTDSCFSDVKWE